MVKARFKIVVGCVGVGVLSVELNVTRIKSFARFFLALNIYCVLSNNTLKLL